MLDLWWKLFKRTVNACWVCASRQSSPFIWFSLLLLLKPGTFQTKLDDYDPTSDDSLPWKGAIQYINYCKEGFKSKYEQSSNSSNAKADGSVR